MNWIDTRTKRQTKQVEPKKPHVQSENSVLAIVCETSNIDFCNEKVVTEKKCTERRKENTWKIQIVFISMRIFLFWFQSCSVFNVFVYLSLGLCDISISNEAKIECKPATEKRGERERQRRSERVKGSDRKKERNNQSVYGESYMCFNFINGWLYVCKYR